MDLRINVVEERNESGICTFNSSPGSGLKIAIAVPAVVQLNLKLHHGKGGKTPNMGEGQIRSRAKIVAHIQKGECVKKIHRSYSKFS